MAVKPTAKLAAFWLILVILLVASAGSAPVSVLAQDESPIQSETLSPEPTESPTQEATLPPAQEESPAPIATLSPDPEESATQVETLPPVQADAPTEPPPAQVDPATGAMLGGEEALSGAVPASVEPTASYPSTAAYNSGWKTILPGQTLLLTHNLYGSVSNYVVELRFYSVSATLESHGYNQIGYGGNQLISPVPAGYEVDDQVGAYWHSLNTTSIKVYRLPQDKTYAAMIRVRIWVITQADYDSGWLSIAPDTALSRTFSIAGGAVDNYLVYLEFNDTGAGLGVHQRYYGGASQAGTNARVGAYWRILTDTSIQVYRRANEDYVDQVRVRIWNQPRPTYDSGWVNGNLGTYVNLTHNVGGDPDDYIVDLQFKDSGYYGVNQKCYGGCDFRLNEGDYSNTRQGAYWRKLTGTNIEVGRRADDVFADQVRVRIWNFWTPSYPDYDSGWKTTLPGNVSQPYHNLGGSEDDYMVNLMYSDATWRVNQMLYGIKYFGDFPPAGYAVNESGGAYWRSLTNTSLVIYRPVTDETVDQWRLRIWRMPKPDYDSGWTAIAQDSAHTFNHGLVGDRSEFLVDVSFNDTDSGSGKNQRYLGGAVTSSNEYLGAHWHSFSTAAGDTHLAVYRYPNDFYADQVRVRIWRVSAPDYTSGYLAYTTNQVRGLIHNLNVDPKQMLVDVTANQPSGDHKVCYGRVDMGTGAFSGYVENDRAGFYWYNLTPTTISAQRMAEDNNAGSINIRIWAWPAEVYLPAITK